MARKGEILYDMVKDPEQYTNLIDNPDYAEECKESPRAIEPTLAAGPVKTPSTLKKFEDRQRTPFATTRIFDKEDEMRLLLSTFTLLFLISGLTHLNAKKSTWNWPPKSKAQAVDLSKFTLDENLEITLWAKSPMFYNPTNMAIDPQGRIWIAEGVNYREKLGIRREAGDRIVVLTRHRWRWLRRSIQSILAGSLSGILP